MLNDLKVLHKVLLSVFSTSVPKALLSCSFSDQKVGSKARICSEVSLLLLSQEFRILTADDTFQLPFGPFIPPLWLAFLSEFGPSAALKAESDS